eukprot:RCo026931
MAEEAVLDDPEAIHALDPLDMLGLQGTYAWQFMSAIALVDSLELPAMSVQDKHEVVVLGTGGGSAALANLVKSYVFDLACLPIHVVQGYTCPAYVDSHSLVLACSHSGSTEEICSSTAQALQKRATVVGMGCGGALMALLRQHGSPYIALPGHNYRLTRDPPVSMMPRACLGFIAGTLLLLLERWGVVPPQREALAEVIRTLEAMTPRYAPESRVSENAAKQAAMALRGLVPVVYGFADHYDGVAWRVKNQLGENGKAMAFWNTIPHLHHDEVVGWDMAPNMKRLGFLLLRDEKDETPAIARRWAATKAMLQERAGACVELRPAEQAQGLLARLMSVVVLGDYISCYVAVLAGQDPTAVPTIDLFKRIVAQQ